MPLTYGALCALAEKHNVTITENMRAFVRAVEEEDLRAQPPSGPVSLAAEHSGMRVDYSGLLNQARNGLRQEPALAEMLRQLQDHLAELGGRWYAGDAAAVDEFLQLYCIETDKRAIAAAKRPHADDAAVDRFAAAMKAKLAQAREKGRGGWQQCDPVGLSLMLREHVEKGDPRDVANFCMFLWNLGKPISDAALPYGKRAAQQPAEPGADERAAFEHWYITNAFDLQRNPVGSRECGLQWAAWQARAAQSGQRAGVAEDNEFLRGFEAGRKSVLMWIDPTIRASAETAQTSERSAFERWAANDVLWNIRDKTKSGVSYKHAETDCAWTGWCARAALAAAPTQQQEGGDV